MICKTPYHTVSFAQSISYTVRLPMCSWVWCSKDTVYLIWYRDWSSLSQACLCSSCRGWWGALQVFAWRRQSTMSRQTSVPQHWRWHVLWDLEKNAKAWIQCREEKGFTGAGSSDSNPIIPMTTPPPSSSQTARWSGRDTPDRKGSGYGDMK